MMSDYVEKIALIASVILMGYNVSEFLSSFSNVSEKAGQFLHMARMNAASESDLRRSNFLLTCVMAVGYSLLIYFSDVVLWLVALLVIKLGITLYISDRVLIQVLRDGLLSQKSFIMSRCDSFSNAVMGLAFALLLVL